MSLNDNRSIVWQFTKSSWGTPADWRAVWDERIHTNAVHRFHSQPEAIVGLEAKKAFDDQTAKYLYGRARRRCWLILIGASATAFINTVKWS